MNRYIVTVHRSGRFTLPSELRRELDLHPGDTLVWFERDGEILFRKAEPHELADVRNDTDSQAPSLSDTSVKQED